jgi:hypothetical protein
VEFQYPALWSVRGAINFDQTGGREPVERLVVFRGMDDCFGRGATKSSRSAEVIAIHDHTLRSFLTMSSIA